ncbi:MAG: ATP synthase subunit I [Clostridia bacterium]|nr:ATP synthase subunit I [Clostridia bacterium]
MKEKNPVLSETVRLLIGELIVCALVVLVYAWIEKTVRWQVILSALIGAAVIVLNFFLLARSTDNLFLTAMEARGKDDMDEEAIAKFTAEYQAKMAARMQISFIIRMATMAVTVVLAFILPFLVGIAATVPLLMQRPILYIGEIFRKKEDKVNHGS